MEEKEQFQSRLLDFDSSLQQVSFVLVAGQPAVGGPVAQIDSEAAYCLFGSSSVGLVLFCQFAGCQPELHLSHSLAQGDHQ